MCFLSQIWRKNEEKRAGRGCEINHNFPLQIARKTDRSLGRLATVIIAIIRVCNNWTMQQKARICITTGEDFNRERKWKINLHLFGKLPACVALMRIYANNYLKTTYILAQAFINKPRSGSQMQFRKEPPFKFCAWKKRLNYNFPQYVTLINKTRQKRAETTYTLYVALVN